MSIASEITRINGNIAAAYTALDGKGATLPETQNSASLADTIESVPTGGGSVNIPQEVKSLIDNIDTMSIADAEDAGWELSNGAKLASASQRTNNYVISSGASGNNALCILVFDDDVPNVIKYNGARGLKASSGTVITDTKANASALNEGTWTIDFTNAQEKWVAIPSSISMSNLDINYLYYNTTYNQSDLSCILRHVKYFCFGANKTSYQQSAYQANLSIQDCSIINIIAGINPNFKGIYAKRITFNVQNANQVLNCPWGILAPLSRDFDVEQFITDYVVSGVEYGVTSFSASDVRSYVIPYYLRKFSCTEKFPIVIDCTTVAASSDTWYIGGNKINDKYTCGFMIPSELFIIPPDMNITWGRGDDRITEAGNSVCDYVTTRSIKFMADHSPNVSNRTLTIGAGNIARINAEDATIIPALQAKGWTVI